MSESYWKNRKPLSDWKNRMPLSDGVQPPRKARDGHRWVRTKLQGKPWSQWREVPKR